MKTMKRFTYLMAIAIVGVALASCDKKNEVEQTSYNPERETVKTQFSINLPANVAGTMKRMPGNTVNAGESLSEFNGIEGAQIIPYTLTTTGDLVVDGKSANQNIIPLGDGQITFSDGNTNSLDNSTQARVYNDVMMPVGTNALLFYGKAIGSAARADYAYETTDDYRHQFGALEAYTAGSHAGLKTNPFTLANVTFQPVKIQGSGRPAGNGGETLMAYLTSVAAATAASADLAGNSAWKTTTELQLSELYTQFTKGYVTPAKPGMQSGASKNVTALMNQLYTTISSLTLDAQYESLRTAILNAINNTTSYVKTAAVYSGGTLTTPLVLKDEIADFPNVVKDGETLNAMPDGSAAITWNESTDQFVVADGATFGTFTVAAWNKYVYPTSLWYFANSTIKADDHEGVAAKFTADTDADDYGTDKWKTEMDKPANYADNAVKASTRSIAMYTPVNYAVGRLDLAVRAKSTAVETSDNAITLNFENIPLTGVLICGENDAKWDFTPGAAADYIYYDNDIANPVVNINGDAEWKIPDPSTTTGKKWNNYTLVLESQADHAINICLEFENNDKDFHGVNGQLIPTGTKFYLLGTLTPSTASNYSAGTLDKVFVKDHKTFARITIGDVKGDKAYNVIPDLKVPQLEFALSVDLEWQQGLIFDQTW